MANARVIGVRSVELGVRDLNQSATFYKDVWGLDEVAAEGNALYLRGTGRDHHLLALREQGKASLLTVDFAAADRETVDQLHAKTKGYGVTVFGDPAPRTATEGGGYGFKFHTPDGLPIRISCEIGEHQDTVIDRSRPTKISHVVLNSAKTDDQIRFFVDVLGFKLTDSTHLMEFLRCSSDHHSMALFRNNGPSLNHIAYEVPDIDGLMRGSGRLKRSGFNVEWGIGRHGPGNNVFSYFIDARGDIVRTDLYDRMVTIGLPQIRKAPTAVGVATGAAKARAVAAAIRGGFVNTLIVDSGLAQALLALPSDGTEPAEKRAGRAAAA